MLWDIFFIYLISTSIIVPAVQVWSLFGDCPGQKLFKDQPRSLQITSITLAAISGVLAGTLIAPFIVYILIHAYLEDRIKAKYWESIRRAHIPSYFEPIHSANIAEDLWQHIETESEVLQDLKFESMGEFNTQGEPYNTIKRILISPDGKTIVEIANLLGDFNVCELTSFLADGTIINTADVEPLDIAKGLLEHNFISNCIPDTEMLDLLVHHFDNIKPFQNCIEKPLTVITANTYQDFMRYSEDRFSEIKYALGKGDEPIKAVFPTQNHPAPGASLPNPVSDGTTLKISIPTHA